VHTGKLQKIINGPEMHRWHHSTGKGRNRNFATKLAIWDWLFGTAYFPETKPDEYGLKTYFPNHYFMQTLFAFRRFKKSKRSVQTRVEA
jgi:sterol desaturase/sphingolipid hydroxylase (fatty acid hydroxylase superfamily)